jgi:hypothetical protein
MITLPMRRKTVLINSNLAMEDTFVHVQHEILLVSRHQGTKRRQMKFADEIMSCCKIKRWCCPNYPQLSNFHVMEDWPQDTALEIQPLHWTEGGCMHHPRHANRTATDDTVSRWPWGCKQNCMGAHFVYSCEGMPK